MWEAGNKLIWRKQYVDVIAMHKQDGTVEIQEILWTDGRKFKVSKTKAGGYASGSKTGSAGKQFIVWIGGRQKMLYLEKNRFFVETYTEKPKAEYGIYSALTGMQSTPFRRA